MILFVFEGEKREPRIFNSLRQLYFKAESIVCFTFGTSFHSLFKQLKENDWDLFYILRQTYRQRNDKTLEGYLESSFSEIYLFFDYDFHISDKQIRLSKWNNELDEMLSFFNHESDNGKLYISYPMVEAIRYTKQLPDSDYNSYTIKREECRRFKQIAAKFSFYPGLNFIDIATNNNTDEVKQNWQELKDQNIKKANFICHGINAYPVSKAMISQQNIFHNQLLKYVSQDDCSVSILSAFPIFLYDYLKLLVSAKSLQIR